MKKIKVDQPFSLRFDSESELREFGKGMHEISETELTHWFIQGCLKEGRAVLVIDAEAEPEASGELVSPTREELMKLKSLHLDYLCKACGITPQDEATKAVMVDLLLAGQEGVTLVKGPDGIHVQKAVAE